MKKNNGFTLIELLATIIILAAVALVAFPILLNTIKNSEGKIDKTTEKLVLSAAKIYVDDNLNEYPKKNGSTYCIPFNKLIEEKHLEKGILDAADVDSDSKVVKVTTTDDYDYKIVNSDECTSKTTICTITRQKEGKYTVGDIVSCELSNSTEYFYIIENEDDDTTEGIDMIAKYNLDAGYEINASNFEITPISNPTGLQKEKARGYADNLGKYYGTIEFADTNYWATTVTSYPEDVYQNNTLIKPIVDKYVQYLNTKLTSAKGSLLTYNQAIRLGCIKGVGCPDYGEWLTTSSYWLGSAENANKVWVIGSNGAFDVHVNNDVTYEYKLGYGVRPVITISKDEL